MKKQYKSFLIFVCLCILFLLGLFYYTFSLKYVMFSNDGPYGSICSEQTRFPEVFYGFWQNLNWLGGEGITPSPDITTAFRTFCETGEDNSKHFLDILNMSSWIFLGFFIIRECLRPTKAFVGMPPRASLVECKAIDNACYFFITLFALIILGAIFIPNHI